ncbi:non-ribosomal peptide synthetase [Trichoderma austrokoningii]
MATQDLEMRHKMERELLKDKALKQAKILNLASPQDEPQWAVAISLAKPADGYEQADVSAVIKRARKALRKMKDYDPNGGFLIPKRWNVLNELPITSTGQVDEKALYRLLNTWDSTESDLSPKEKRARIAAEAVRPDNSETDVSSQETELVLRELWSRLVALAESNPVLTKMAAVAALDQINHAAYDVEPLALLPQTEIEPILDEIRTKCDLADDEIIRDAFPCTALQAGIMALAEKQPGSHTVERCDNLRTRVLPVNGLTIQAVVEAKEITMTYGSRLCRYALIHNADGKSYFLYYGQEYTQSIDQDAASAFWMKQLQDARRANFPRALNSKSNIAGPTVLRAAWAIVLARQAPVPRINRMAVHLMRDESISKFLQDIQSQASEMVEFEQYGLQNIARLSEDARDACDFSSLLVIQPSSSAEKELFDASMQNYFNYPLVLETFVEDGHGIVEALFHHFDHVVQQLLQPLNRPLSTRFNTLRRPSKDLVHVCFEKSAWYFIAILAINKAGAAWRLRQIVSQTKAKLALASPTCSNLYLDIRLNECSTRGPNVDVSPSNLCTPKGFAIAKRLGITPQARTLQFASYVFDLSVSCCCVPSADTRMDGIVQFIRDMKINWAGFTPSFARTIDPSDVPTFERDVFQTSMREIMSADESNLNIAPIGVVGEIYLNDPKKTSEAVYWNRFYNRKDTQHHIRKTLDGVALLVVQLKNASDDMFLQLSEELREKVVLDRNNELRKPETEMERLMQKLCFLQIGGDSLAAIHLVAAAHIFGDPRLRIVASRTVITSAFREIPASISPFSLLRGSITVVEDAFPCTSLQQGLLALSMTQSGLYVARQETVLLCSNLRTRIVPFGDATIQAVIKGDDEWDSTDGLSVETYIQRPHMQAMGHAESGLYFVFSAHHCIFDGWSLPLIFGTLGAPYADFVKHTMGLDRNAAVEYWTDQLQGAQQASFPPAVELTRRSETKATRVLTHTVQFSTPKDLVLNLESIPGLVVATIPMEILKLSEEAKQTCNFTNAAGGSLLTPITTGMQCQLHDQGILQEWRVEAIPMTSEWNPPIERKAPGHEALFSSESSLTYAELDGPEVIVPFCMEKSVWAIVAMLAIMKAGGVYLPLDPSNPVKRRKMIVAEVGASINLFILSRSTITKLSASLKNAVRPINRPGNAAYVLFTSGSTGQPKGFGKAADLSNTSRSLQFSAFIFDISVAEILGTLVFGGTVCIPDFIRRANVNIAFLTPSFLRTMSPSQVPDLKAMMLVGEAAARDTLDAWCGHVRLVNLYGPTEITVCCTAHEPYNSACWVIEPGNPDKLAPIGCVGELVIQGHTKTSQVFLSEIGVRYLAGGAMEYFGRKDKQATIKRLMPEVAYAAAENNDLHDLPGYMVPSLVIPLREMPFNAALKLDQQLTAYSLTDRDRIAPTTEMEVKLQQTIANQHGIKLPVDVIFADSKLSEAELAPFSLLPFERTDSEGLMALTATRPGSYIAKNAYKLPAYLDVATFKAAWEKTISLFEDICVQVVLDHDVLWEEASATDAESYVSRSQNTENGEANEAPPTLISMQKFVKYFMDMDLRDAKPASFPPRVTRRQATVEEKKTFMRAAWAIILARYWRTASIPGLESMPGVTIATVPVRIRLGSDVTLSNFLERVQIQASEMLSSQIKEACDFSSLMVKFTEETLQNYFTYPLVLHCFIGEESVKLVFIYDATLLNVIQQLVTPDGRKLSDVNVAEECIHTLIDRTAAKYPDLPALIAAANRLAHHLVNSLVATLAISKAGAAWSPLDPAHPLQRHKQVVAQTGSSLALASPSNVSRLSEKLDANTGTPKGVVIEHVTLCSGQTEASKRVAEIISPLLTGACYICDAQPDIGEAVGLRLLNGWAREDGTLGEIIIQGPNLLPTMKAPAWAPYQDSPYWRRCYKTGDLAIRKDMQVKIRGLRIELVCQVAVDVLKTDVSTTLLHALRARLNSALPTAMPLATSGKLDRKKLLGLTKQLDRQELSPYALEDGDKQMWRIGDQGISLTVVAAKAYSMEEDVEEQIEDAYPCSKMQEGLMALAIKQPGSYIAKFIYRLSDSTDISKFKDAWERTVKALGDILWDNTSGKSLETQYAVLMDESTQKSYFILTMHHAIFDGWSVRNILDMLQNFYHAVEYWESQLQGGKRASSANAMLRATWALVLARQAEVHGLVEMIGPIIATVPVRLHHATSMVPYEQFGTQNIAKISNEAKEACNFSSLLVDIMNYFSYPLFVLIYNSQLASQTVMAIGDISLNLEMPDIIDTFIRPSALAIDAWDGPHYLVNDAWHMISILAINKAGAAWRLAQIVSQTKATIALTSLITTSLDKTLSTTFKGLCKQGPRTSVSHENDVYMLFTSGSTGTPKGFVMQHAKIKVLQFAAYVFDLSIGEIIAPLITEYIRDTGINWAFFTPSFIRTIKPADVSGLELVLLAGEAVPRDVLNTWFGKVRLVNGWGPAETCSSLTVGKPVGGPTLLRDWAPHQHLSYYSRFYKSGDLGGLRIALPQAQQIAVDVTGDNDRGDGMFLPIDEDHMPLRQATIRCKKRAPETPMESLLQKSIGRDDSFLSLGARDDGIILHARDIFDDPQADAAEDNISEQLSFDQIEGSYTAKYVYRLTEQVDIDRFRSATLVVKNDHLWDDSSNNLKAALSQFTITKDTDGNNYFLWTIHHAIHDGWTVPLLLQSFIQHLEDTDESQAQTRPAAWAIVLAKYCNSDDVCFGATISGRQASVDGLLNVAGPTVATVPIRVRIDRKQQVSDFLQVIQRKATEMMPYEQFAKMACDFSSLLLIQPMQHGLDAQETLVQNYYTYPLVIQGHIYSDHVEFSQIEALIHQFDVSLNDSKPEIIDYCASPNAPAIYAWDGQLTYAGLEEATDRLALHLLQKFNVCVGDIIHVCFEKSIWYVVAILAINKAGATWAPLDPAHPIQRLHVVVKQTGSTLTLSSVSHVKLSRQLTKRVVEKIPASNLPLVDVTSKDGAYILFTSGSTGAPKGIRLKLTKDVRMLQFSSFVFDVSVGEIMAPLMHALNEFVRIAGPEDFTGLKLLLLVGEAFPQEVLDGCSIHEWKSSTELISTIAPIGCQGEIVVQGPALLLAILSDLPEWAPDHKTKDWGRQDVKIRGLRVELGEIEHRVRSALSSARQVSVDVFTNDSATHLVTPHQMLKQSDEVEALHLVLPRHMIPTLMIGNFSQQQWSQFALADGAPKSGPETSMEARLQKLWASILNIPVNTIGRNDSFLRIGGDSIGAIQLINQIFENSRLSHLASVARDIDGKEDGQFMKTRVTDPSCRDEYGLEEDDLQEGLMAIAAKQQGSYMARNLCSNLRTRIVLANTIWKTFKIGYNTALCHYCLFEDNGEHYFALNMHHATFSAAYEETDLPKLLPYTRFLNEAKPTIFPPQHKTSSAKQSTAVLEQRIHATILRAAWSIILARYSDIDDVCFGSVVSGRNASVPVRFLEGIQSQASEMVPIDEHTKVACNFSSLMIVQPAKQMEPALGSEDLEHVMGNEFQHVISLSSSWDLEQAIGYNKQTVELIDECIHDLFSIQKSVWAVVALVQETGAETMVISSVSRSSCNGLVKNMATEANPAYIVFTSGSTGRPKGLGQVVGIFVPLINGGTVYVPGFILKAKCNHMFLTPSFARTIDPISVPTIKTLTVGVRLFNVYGPTEACVIAMAHEVHATWIVDADDRRRLTPIGCVGELVIQGNVLSSASFSESIDCLTPSFIGGPQNFYFTGDLVKKDLQIEYHLKRSLPNIDHVAVDVLHHSFIGGNTGDNILLPLDDSVRSALVSLILPLKRMPFVDSLKRSEPTTEMERKLCELFLEIVNLAQKATSGQELSKYIEDAYPCTQLQQGIMALSMKQLGSYVAKNTYRLPAWGKTMEICTNLRTRIVLVNNTAVQIILHDCHEWDATDGIDLPTYCQTVLVRYALIEHNGNHNFCLTMHHSIFDGWSMSCIMGTLDAVYRGNELPPLAQYAHFVNAYWLEQLHEARRASFPAITRYVSKKIDFSNLPKTSVTKAVSGRNAALIGADSMPGVMLATVPVQYLRKIQAQSTTMTAYEQFGLQNISSLSENAREACNFSSLLGSGNSAAILDRIQNFINYPLVVQALLFDNKVEIILMYNTACVSKSQAVALSEQFNHVIQQLVSHVEQPLSEISVAGPWDLQQAINLAIYSTGGSMSYAKLDLLSSQLAVILRENGVGLDVFVPICLEKSAWAIVAMLALVSAIGAEVLIVSPSTARECVDLSKIKDTTITNIAKGTNAAYLLWTSGSTSLPKGVVVEHQGIYSQIFAALTAGGTFITDAQVNIALLTPTVVKTLTPDSDILQTWYGRLDLRNAYGPAEAYLATSIGLGCVGELLVQGPALARGYFADEEKTKSSFLEDFRRFYKTGDLYLGRKDTQIKIRGQRLEVGEIEYQVKKLERKIEHVAVDIVNKDKTNDDAAKENIDFQLWENMSYVLPQHILPAGKLDLPTEQLAQYLTGQKTIFRDCSNDMEVWIRSQWAVDDNFYQLGGDSIRIVTLAKSILSDKHTTISSMAKFIKSGGDVASDQGSKTIIVLVRCNSPQHGLERIRATAQTAKWWRKKDTEKIEVWAGDLGKPQLGLNASQWERLSGTSKTHSNIDAIVHNGAVVNWNADYDKLRAPNVDSAFELINITAASPAHPRFVFVSGGLKTDPEDDQAAVASQLEPLNGYVQTKFVCECLIQNALKSLPAKQNRLSIVKPGRIIGSQHNGIANVDDLIWRVVSGAAAIHAYPVESAENWMYIADVSCVASTVLNQVLEEDPIRPLVHVTGGMPAPVFWKLVNEALDVKCKPVSWEEWKETALVAMNEIGDKHPLWPVQHFLGALGAPRSVKELATEPSEHKQWHAAVKKNVQYLKSIGFIASSVRELGNVKDGAIKRIH